MVALAPAEGIEICGRHNPLAWHLYFTRLTVEVDGQPQQGPWRQQRFVAAPPGDHGVKVFFRYLAKRRCGEAGAAVQVAPGQVARLEYHAPRLTTSPGKLTIVG